MLAAVVAAAAAASGQRVVVTHWGADSVRIQAALDGAAFSASDGALLPPAGPAQQQPLVAGGAVTNGNLRVSMDGAGRIAATRVSDGAELFSELVPRTIAPRGYDPRHALYSNTTLYSVHMAVKMRDGEKLYGMGQHTHGSLDNRGKSVAGVPGAFLPSNTEVFIPFVVSSLQYGYLHNYPGLGAFAWDESHGSTNWTGNAAQGFDLWITTSSADGAASWPQQVMSNYADATGHSPVLPKWATGLWQSKNRYQTQEELLSVARGYRERNLSISVMVIDYFSWSPQWVAGDYRFDSTCWPDPAGMIQELDSMGIKLMVSTYSNFVNNRSVNWDGARALGDVFVVDANGSTITDGFQDSAVYDLFGQKAREYVWRKLQDTYVKLGVRVFWQDCDEYCTKAGSAPDSWSRRVYYPSVGIDEAVAGAYPKVLAQTFSDGFESAGISDGIQLGRSAWAGSQRYGSALWSGDIGSTWESLKMSIPAGLNAGMSGIVWWTTDVGGYGGSHGRAMNTSDPSARELMVRWVQFGVFCPLFRIHGYRAPTMEPTCTVCQSFSCDQSHETAAWAYGDVAYDAIAKMIRLRESMRGYIDGLMEEASQKGHPVMRPLWFEFPADGAVYSDAIENAEYMFGDSYLIAPVTDLGARSRSVYFPKGAQWTHYSTGAVFEGGSTAVVDAPLDTPLVFRRG